MSLVTHDSPGVQSYLQILQGVISRMAANSASAKTWCVALVSGMLVVLADRNSFELLWLAAIPLALFLFLDAYYLGLEKRFRDSYNDFIKKLHDGSAVVEDLYVISPGSGLKIFSRAFGKALASPSVWPFYVFLAGLVALVHTILSKGAAL